MLRRSILHNEGQLNKVFPQIGTQPNINESNPENSVIFPDKQTPNKKE
jgi:hypothetical protein